MRRYLSPELRHRFDIAWRMLPDEVSQRLKASIVDVRSADTLEGVRIICEQGRVLESTEDGYGWCAFDGETQKLYIRLKTILGTGVEEVGTVYTILHEFAHCIEFLEDGVFAQLRSNQRSEAAACSQVIAWAMRSETYAKYTGVAECAFEILHRHSSLDFMPDELIEAVE